MCKDIDTMTMGNGDKKHVDIGEKERATGGDEGKGQATPLVGGGMVAQTKLKKPHGFFDRIWSPISYILYLWFGGLLRLVRFCVFLWQNNMVS